MPAAPFMPLFPLGRITVAVPGTLVNLLDGWPHVKATATHKPWPLCAGDLIFQPAPGNGGAMYFGVAGMVRATGVGIALIFPIPAAGSMIVQRLPALMGNDFRLEDYYVDADNPGDSLIVSAFISATR